MKSGVETVTAVKGFDLQVTHRDETTGLVTHTNPYVMRTISAPDGGKRSIWERPAGSKNLYDKKNNPCGRWVTDKNGKGKHDPKAEHVLYTIPETKDQKLAKELIESQVKISALEKELESIKADPKKKES